MEPADFIKRVCNYGKIDTPEEGLRAIGSVMKTLAERVGPDEVHDTYAQLPAEISVVIPQIGTGEAEQFDVDEFIRRVASYAQVNQQTARSYSRAVLSALQDRISAGQLEDLMARLPREFDELFASREAGGGS